MLNIKVVTQVFEVPRVIFTLHGNPKSQEVINELQKLSLLNPGGQEYHVFAVPEDVQAYFDGGVSPLSSVALFDVSGGQKCFTMCTQHRSDDVKTFPYWARNVQWGVRVYSRCNPAGCARQLKADFCKKFEDQLALGCFPWGNPRKHELPPVHVTLPADVRIILAKLNEGPDLAAAIADKEFALELPRGSRISWYRVAAEPIGCDAAYLKKVVSALYHFEQVCGLLADTVPEIHTLLLAGVDIDPFLSDIYLSPRVPCFSIGRPDLHYDGTGVFASEIDEMPGGFAELIHLDHVYGINQERWQKCFNCLFERGPVLFVVSHEWSKCYIPEMEWLVGYLRKYGYSAHFVTTDALQGVHVEKDGVNYHGVSVGTVWRQFPIFETKGKLADLVLAAWNGKVRMMPEFAHFGNKAWFSIFRSNKMFYEHVLDADTFTMLDTVLPDSHLILSEQSFPFFVVGEQVDDLPMLRNLSEDMRNRLVLKVCGANTLAARSYGVLMGSGLDESIWKEWIDERVKNRQPFIVQRHMATSVARVPVLNTNRGCAELFNCRVLLRPWTMYGELLSVSACAVPSNTLRVHGRVDMAVLPVVFE